MMQINALEYGNLPKTPAFRIVIHAPNHRNRVAGFIPVEPSMQRRFEGISGAQFSRWDSTPAGFASPNGNNETDSKMISNGNRQF
jgi:hypothetical protein